MQKYALHIKNIWEMRNDLNQNRENKITINDYSYSFQSANDIIHYVINYLNEGKLRVSEKIEGEWVVNEWIKQSILLYFQFNDSKLYNDNLSSVYDKVPPKFYNSMNVEDFKTMNIRVVPGAYARRGSYIAPGVVLMPSFVNIGAYIDSGTLVDSFSTIGSCAQIGKNCHISGGVGIGGVLEPLQTRPVIIEDNCFIGARSEIAEGVIIEEGAVISMGVFITSSTKIVYRDTGKIIYGRVPPYSVVVPGSMPATTQGLPSISCAVIIKQVDASTRKKTEINMLLRD